MCVVEIATTVKPQRPVVGATGANAGDAERDSRRPPRGGPRDNKSRGERRPPREGQRAYDRQSSQGNERRPAKGGAGRGNWGSEKEEVSAAEQRTTAATGEVVPTSEGEESPGAPETPVAAEDAAAKAEAEAKPVVRSYADYKKNLQTSNVQAQRLANDGKWSNVKKIEREDRDTEKVVRPRSGFTESYVPAGIRIDSAIGDVPAISSPPAAKPAFEREREREGPRPSSARGGARGRGGDRGAPRGGAGRGGFRGPRPNVGDNSAFPALGAA